MQKDNDTAQYFYFLAIGSIVLIAPHLPEWIALAFVLFFLWRIHKLDKN